MTRSKDEGERREEEESEEQWPGGSSAFPPENGVEGVEEPRRPRAVVHPQAAQVDAHRDPARHRQTPQRPRIVQHDLPHAAALTKLVSEELGRMLSLSLVST